MNYFDSTNGIRYTFSGTSASVTSYELATSIGSNVMIYVDGGQYVSPYYNFYMDYAKTTIFNGTLTTNNTYTFQGINISASHPFYISDNDRSASNTIVLTGSGAFQTGITGSGSFSLSFNGLSTSATLNYYCTAHSNMNGSFTLTSSSGSNFNIAPIILDTFVVDSVTYTVDSITGEPFKDKSDLQELTLPSHLSIIKSEQFSGCSSLTKIILRNIILPDIEETAFVGTPQGLIIQYKYNETEQSVDDFMSTFIQFTETGITYTLFRSNNKAIVTSYDTTTSIVIMQDDITLNDGITNPTFQVDSFKTGIFQGQTALTDITLSNRISILDGSSFNGCTQLKNVNHSLNTVGTGEFENCANMNVFSFQNVQTIGQKSFKNTGLSSVALSHIIDASKNCFSDCGSLQKVVFGEFMETVVDEMFANCNSLTNISLGTKVKTINTQAFKNCSSLKHLTLPSNITTIHESAFTDCVSLERVRLNHTVNPPLLGTNAFSEIKTPNKLLHNNIDVSQFETFTELINLKLFLFPYDMVEKDHYNYAFYNVSRKDTNTIRMKIYNNDGVLQSSSQQTLHNNTYLDVLERSVQSLKIGNETSTPNVDVAFAGVYQEGWNMKQQSRLMKDLNKRHANIYSNELGHFVIKVENGKFTLNGDVQPVVFFDTAGLYVFEQTDESNIGHAIRFKDSYNVEFTSNIRYEGIIGKSYAYTLMNVDENTPQLYYYSESDSTMLSRIINTTIIPNYHVKVEYNYLNKPYFSVATSSDGTYSEQPYIDISSGLYVFFNDHVSNTGFSMFAGTGIDAVDSVGSNTNYTNIPYPPGNPGSYLLIDMPLTSTETLYYFSDDSANMGYVPHEYHNADYSFNLVVKNEKLNIDDIFNPVIQFESNKKYLFLQDDSSNLTFPLAFGEPHNSHTFQEEGVFIQGTAGNTDAYTLFVVPETFNGDYYKIDKNNFFSTITITVQGGNILNFSQIQVWVNNVNIAPYGTISSNIIHSKYAIDGNLSTFIHGSYDKFVLDLDRIVYYNDLQSIVIYNRNDNDINYYHGIIGASIHLNNNLVVSSIQTATTAYKIKGLASETVTSDNISANAIIADDAIHVHCASNRSYNVEVHELPNIFSVNYDICFNMPDYLQLNTDYSYNVIKNVNSDLSYNIDTSANLVGIDISNVITFENNLQILPRTTVYSFSATTGGTFILNIDNRVKIYKDIPDVIYTVTVSNNVFYINGKEKPKIYVSQTGFYLFDQSDSSNIGNQMILSTVADNVLHNIDFYTYGTPGIDGYVFFYYEIDLDPVYYFSTNTQNMGNAFINVTPLESYTFSTRQNILDEIVYSSFENGSYYYNQPLISFQSNQVYRFNVSHSSNTDYRLTFGTTIDDMSSELSNNIAYGVYDIGTANSTIYLDLKDYTGPSVYYFADGSSNMGYNPPPAVVDYSFNATVVNKKLYLDNSFNPNINFETNNKYLFMQNDISNDGFPLVIGDNHNSHTFKSDGVMIKGHPGRAGAYTLFDVPVGFTGDYYKVQRLSTIYVPDYDVSFELPKYLEINNDYSYNVTNYLDVDLSYVIDPKPVTINLDASGSVPNYLNDYTINSTAGGFFNLSIDNREKIETYVADTAFTVTVANDTFYINGKEKPKLYHSKSGYYLFDQSDSSNLNSELVFTDISDVVQTFFTKGTPGVDGFTFFYYEIDSGPLYYGDSKGNVFNNSTIDISYTIAANTNVLGDDVFTIFDPIENRFIAQKNIDINTRALYHFNTEHSSNFGFNLRFEFGNVGDLDNFTTYSLEDQGTPGSNVYLDIR
jgi:hypothetical protein